MSIMALEALNVIYFFNLLMYLLYFSLYSHLRTRGAIWGCNCMFVKQFRSIDCLLEIHTAPLLLLYFVTCLLCFFWTLGTNLQMPWRGTVCFQHFTLWVHAEMNEMSGWSSGILEMLLKMPGLENSPSEELTCRFIFCKSNLYILWTKTLLKCVFLANKIIFL
jgi:hypothetical protein